MKIFSVEAYGNDYKFWGAESHWLTAQEALSRFYLLESIDPLDRLYSIRVSECAFRMYLLRKEYKNGPLFFSRKNAEVRLQTLHANGKDNYEIKEIYKYDLDLEEAHDKPRTISVLGEHDIGMVIAYSKD